ncbi:hypothetical protein EDD37DRAFT_512027 [Exophiala viscosa]|uniref:CID domain-containing protein n=1 Tax=Exophiala viscosa TaxID=2486360 RepID=A0AAN6IF49_9EURO|nr:hypothetical protein EDD36DRAFT_178806 [Exophiala viscosa]KAI1622243.1 hypothetical protein EDD37DRAFT_512027 [Exophiala viscosa]
MAHHLSLAKAAFGASLLRHDVTKVSRDELPQFHSAFEAVLSNCSRQNIQTCKGWLLENVAVSATRITAFGRFLANTSKHLASQADETASSTVPRQRLHILYLLNDLLHHSRYHATDKDLHTTLTQSLHPFLSELFQLATKDAKPKISRRLQDLVEIWQGAEYLEKNLLDRIADILTGIGPGTTEEVQAEPKLERATKELPYNLPATHGDPSLPFYDLPAGNLMPLIVPNSSQPMRADDIRALHFSAGAADESLVNALKDFLVDVQSMDDTVAHLEKTGLHPEMDEMGQIWYRDEAGDLIGDTYYGWSRAFCEKMRGRDRSESGDASQRSGSGRSSRSRSRSRVKRRRYSTSDDGRSGMSRSYSRSRSRRRSPSRGRAASRSRSRSISPEQSRPMLGRSQHPDLPPHPSHYSPIPPPPPAHGLPSKPPAQFGGALVLPPPDWTGPWPPPPPPPASQLPGNAGFPNLPFPPPPPPSSFPTQPGAWPPYPPAPPPGYPYGGNNTYNGRR